MSNYDMHIVLKIFSSGFSKILQEYFVYFKKFFGQYGGKIQGKMCAEPSGVTYSLVTLFIYGFAGKIYPESAEYFFIYI